MAGFSVKVEFDEEKFYEAIEEFKKNNPDFVEVVRCRDCKHRFTHTCGVYYGTTNFTDFYLAHGDDFYCAYGERKEVRE